MAGKAASATTAYHRGDQDIHEQQATFRLVMGFTKWGSLAIATLVLFLVLWFCTDTGLLGAGFTAVVLVALGITFLRSRPEAGH